MINLNKHSLDLSCPRCGFYNPVTLKQIRLRDAVICRGCKGTINFEDYMNEIRKAVRSIKKSMIKLKEQICKTHKITIRL